MRTLGNRLTRTAVVLAAVALCVVALLYGEIREIQDLRAIQSVHFDPFAAYGASSGADLCDFNTSYGTLSTRGLYPCRLDSTGGMYVDIDNASVAVTGTFWQTTQPVSGTFWQTTQPVSLASLPALAAGSALIGFVQLDGTNGGSPVALAANGAGNLLINNANFYTAGNSGLTANGTSATALDIWNNSSSKVDALWESAVTAHAMLVDASGSTVSVPDTRSSANSVACQTLNAAYTVNVSGDGVVGFQLVGLTACGGTVTFEASADGGTTWIAVNAVAGSNLSTTATADAMYRVDSAGRTNVRVRVSTVGSTANITVSYTASIGTGVVSLGSALPPGTNVVGYAGDSLYLPTTGTMHPAYGTSPDQTQTCHSITTGPGAMVNAWMVSPAAQPGGSSLEWYDEGSSPTCAAADVIYSTGQVAAGYIYGKNAGPLTFNTGLAFKILSGTAFTGSYGMKFKTIP